MTIGTFPRPHHPLKIVLIIAIVISALVAGFALFCPLYSERANEEQSVVNGIQAETTANRIAASDGIYPDRRRLRDSLAVVVRDHLINPYNRQVLEIRDVSSVGRPVWSSTNPIPEFEGHLGYYVSQDGLDATIFAFGKDGRIAEELKLPTLPRRH